MNCCALLREVFKNKQQQQQQQKLLSFPAESTVGWDMKERQGGLDLESPQGPEELKDPKAGKKASQQCV